MAELLEVKNLSVTYRSPRGDVQAVRDVSFSLRPGEVLAVVGESGCGKSALCRAVMRLLPDSAAVSGEILVNGVDIAPYRPSASTTAKPRARPSRRAWRS